MWGFRRSLGVGPQRQAPGDDQGRKHESCGGDDWKTMYITTRNTLVSVELKKAGIPVPVGG